MPPGKGRPEQTKKLSTGHLHGKKSLSEDMIFLYEDESHIRDYQALHAIWVPVGKQKKIPTQGHHAKVTLFGAVNVQDGKVLCMESPKCDAVSFLQFFQYVLEQYPNRYIVMTLDNTRIHYAKLVQPFLKKNREQLMLVSLPAILTKSQSN